MTFPDAKVRPGDVFDLGTAVMDRASMLAFAERYDPQPFHLDDEAAGRSMFGGLIASGLQTLAVLHASAVRSGVLLRLGAEAGMGMDRVRFASPVRPDDALHVTMEALSVGASRNRPGQGVARCLVTATNQDGTRVASYESSILVRLDRWAME